MLDISSDKLLWLLPACVVGGLLYGVFQYYRKPIGSKLTTRLLTAFRSISVALIIFLLLGPMIEQVFETKEKPVVPILIDHSTSVALTSSLKPQALLDSCEAIEDKLKAEGYDVQFYNFDGRLDSADFLFDAQNSALNKQLKRVSQTYEFANVPLGVMISDGITNSGSEPSGEGLSFPWYTVFAGDSLPKSDLAIGKIKYNRFGFVGNKVPLVAEVLFNEIDAPSVKVKVTGTDGQELIQTVKRTNTLGLEKVSFLVDLKEEGQVGFDVSVEELPKEVTYQNNKKRVFIRAEKNRKKILFLAAAPHPDIKLFKRALEPYEEYEITVAYEKDLDKVGELTDDMSLIVCHQVPSKNSGVRVVKFLEQVKVPKLYIIGNQTDLMTFNRIQNQFGIKGRNGSIDEVHVAIESNFSSFHLNTEDLGFLNYAPPIKVPFGTYEQSGLDVLAFQKVGSVVTDNALMAIGLEASNKTGFIVGEGWWRLSLFEYLDTEEQVGLNDLLAKLIAVLIESNDKKKFVCEPSKSSFNKLEGVSFQVELYNELFESVFDELVTLKVKDEAGKVVSYKLSLVEGKDYYGLPDMKEGIYQYEAESNYGGKLHKVSGEFVVVDKKIESVELLGKPEVLARISHQSGGQFYAEMDANGIADDILALNSPDVLHFTEEYVELIKLKWLFAAIVVLLTLEWAGRKWNNKY